MRKILAVAVSLTALILGACGSSSKALTVEERQLIDVRHDHLRCEVKLDRLRDLYQVTREEPSGLMHELEAGNVMGDPALDAPLTGGHDAPLTGGHDSPLTGGHDAPLTGGHDYANALREAVYVKGQACWDAVSVLVNLYNECVVAYVACKEANPLDTTCITTYDTCVTGKHP